MDPLGRCLIIYFVFLILTAFYSVSAAVISTLRAPEEDDENEYSVTVNRLYSKKNAYRYRIMCAYSLCVLVCGISGAYVINRLLPDNFISEFSVLSSLISVVCASILPCSVGIYLPTALIERFPTPPALYSVSNFALYTAHLFAVIPVSISRIILKFAKIEPDMARSDVTEQEILQLVDEGESSGALNSEEREMIENIFDFSEHTVREVMKHYKNVAAIKNETPDEKILELISGNRILAVSRL